MHRYGGEVSLVMLDLDDFKQVNDRHGHATGNEVLRQAGGVLRSAARDSDVAARFGGEELVLLVRGDERSATAAAARVVPGLRELRFADGLRVTCSAGVAALAEGGDSASLFASADEALYEAKRRGKDRVVARAPARTLRAQRRAARRVDCLAQRALAQRRRRRAPRRSGRCRGCAAGGRWPRRRDRGRTGRRDARASRR